MSLHEFQNFSADRMDIHQLIALEAFGHQLREAYDRAGVDEPDFVDQQLKSLKREIRVRNADSLEARKAQVERALNALKTPNQRKQELLREKAKIEEQLQEVS